MEREDEGRWLYECTSKCKMWRKWIKSSSKMMICSNTWCWGCLFTCRLDLDHLAIHHIISAWWDLFIYLFIYIFTPFTLSDLFDSFSTLSASCNLFFMFDVYGYNYDTLLIMFLLMLQYLLVISYSLSFEWRGLILLQFFILLRFKNFNYSKLFKTL